MNTFFHKINLVTSLPVHILPVSVKAEDFEKMLLHLQDHLDLQQQQPDVAVLVAAGLALLLGLLVAMQPRIQGSPLSHLVQQFQLTVAVLSASNAAA
jgi:hypothetical protein